MRRKSSPPLKLFLLTAAAACLAAPPAWLYSQPRTAPAAAQKPADGAGLPPVVYPPGAVAAFAEPASGLDGRAPAAFIRPAEGARESALEVRLLPAGEGAGGAARGASLVAFVVPPLPRGEYVARYVLPAGAGAAGGAAGAEMRLFIEPQLRAVEGVVEGRKGETKEVRVSTGPPAGGGGARPAVEVTLSAPDPSLVTLAPGQAQTVKTGPDGTAVWKVLLAGCGPTVLRATAHGFEPTEVYVVCPLSAAERKRAAARIEDEAARARLTMAALVEQFYTDSLAPAQAQAPPPEEAPNPRRGPRPPQSGNANTARPAPAPHEHRAERRGGPGPQDAAAGPAAQERLRELQAGLAESRERLHAAEVKADLLAAPPLAEARLLPGDVLLILGDGFVSRAIRSVERKALGRPVDYSHAAIYLGERPDGVKEIAEMLGEGFVRQPLDHGMIDDRVVDVYRWAGRLDAADRGRLVEVVERFRGTVYAYPKIRTLMLAAGVRLTPRDVFTSAAEAAEEADRAGRARPQMICSEMVVRAYHLAGLHPEVVTWWQGLAPVLTSDERRHDYTTPNTLAANADKFVWVGRLKPQF